MLEAFQPMGDTLVITAGTAASTAVQCTAGSNYSYRFYNSGVTPVYVEAGLTSTALAVIPSSGTPANGMPLAPGAIEVFNLGPNQFLSAISSAGTNVLYVTNGFGV